MSDAAHFLLFFTSVLVLAVTPGLGISGLIYQTLNLGSKAGVEMSLGIFGARLSKILIILSAYPFLQMANQTIIDMLCLAGAIYLVWNAIRILKAPSPFSQSTQQHQTYSGRQMVLNGFVLSWCNPKTIIFVLTIFPHFLIQDGSFAMPLEIQFFMLGLIWMLVNLIVEVVYILAASFMRRHIARYESLVAKTSALVLATLAVLLVLEGLAQK